MEELKLFLTIPQTRVLKFLRISIQSQNFSRNILSLCFFQISIFFDSPSELKDFLDTQSDEDDIMIRLHSSVLGDDPGIGHMVLFEGLAKDMVYLADPLPPMLKSVTIQELWDGMNVSEDEVRRGLFLIKASSL